MDLVSWVQVDACRHASKHGVMTSMYRDILCKQICDRSHFSTHVCRCYGIPIAVADSISIIAHDESCFHAAKFMQPTEATPPLCLVVCTHNEQRPTNKNMPCVICMRGSGTHGLAVVCEVNFAATDVEEALRLSFGGRCTWKSQCSFSATPIALLRSLQEMKF